MKESKFEIGDEVRCISNEGWDNVEVGEIGTVTEVSSGTTKVYIKRLNHAGLQFHERWELIKRKTKKEGGNGMSKFKVGDLVIQKESGRHTSPEDNNKVSVVTAIGGYYYNKEPGIKIEGDGFYLNDDGWRGEKAFEFAKTTNKKGSKMKKAITDVYEKTQDALLVEEQLGPCISDNFFAKTVLEGNKNVFLAEAKRLKAEKSGTGKEEE